MNINGYKLDSTQEKAIKCNDDAVIVIAGAGSGKSLTILGKIKYIIDEYNIKEDEILCISFTNEAVNSLKNKINEIGYNIDVYTFHKLSLKILNNKYGIISDNYLDYIIDEYFESYIKYSKNNLYILRTILFSDIDVNKLYISKEYIKLKKLISTFIRLMKSNNMDLRHLYYIYKHTFFKSKKIIKFIMDIYLIYLRELESINKIDFDDMIILAKNEVSKSNINYKYIIIDEFQDTSIVRYELINEIIKKCNSKLFVVGDDYQSIYRFSGCNLDLFVNFNKYFNNTSYYYLEYTYRFSNELIYISTNFIMKNKKQLYKLIKSNKYNNKPIKIFFYYSFKDILKNINDDIDLLVLGRNNSDLNDIEWDYKMTIHKSKGLEANNVLLLNSDNIPSKIKNESLLKYVLKDKDYIIYEEERRLFYVALTRTKNNIYIQVKKRISPFIKELIHDYKDYIDIYY